jgi:hypothetical protein
MSENAQKQLFSKIKIKIMDLKGGNWIFCDYQLHGPENT